jgi:hypothetical protein
MLAVNAAVRVLAGYPLCGWLRKCLQKHSSFLCLLWPAPNLNTYTTPVHPTAHLASSACACSSACRACRTSSILSRESL